MGQRTAAARGREDEREETIASDAYREWRESRLTRLRAAVPPPDREPGWEGLKRRRINLGELVTPEGRERARHDDEAVRARHAAAYEWECAAIDREERTGQLVYRIACYNLSPIVERRGGWAITTYGIEKLYGYYPIRGERIHGEDDWVEHLGGKVTVAPRSLADFRFLHDRVRDGQDAGR